MSYQSGLVFKSLGSSQSSCTPAAKPVVYEVPKTVVPVGTTTATLLTLSTGQSTGLGGYIDNTDQCLNYNVTLKFLYGSDCDKCITSPLIEDNVTVFVPAGAVFNLPPVYWTEITYEVTDSSGVALAGGAVIEGSFGFSSIHVPACPKCTPLVGDTVEPAAKVKK